jgi:hypothetical protein
MYEEEPMLPATTSPSLMPMPRLRQRREAREHLARGPHRALRAVGLFERHAEAEHETVARHVKHRALVAEGDLGEEREVLIEQRHYKMRLELLGDAGEAAQVREQHDRVCARIRGGEQRVAQLRIFEDLVRNPRGDIAAEGLPQHFLAAPDFRLKLYRSCLPAHGSRAHQRLNVAPQSLVCRHMIPNEIILLNARLPHLH